MIPSLRQLVRLISLIALLAALVLVQVPASASQEAAPASPNADLSPDDPPGVDPSEVLSLRKAAEGNVQLSTNPATGVASFIRVSPGGDLLSTTALDAPVAKSAAFLADFGSLFGVTRPAAELVLSDVATDAYGFSHISYQQVYQGTPVFAAVLRLHVNARGQLTSANGVFVPDIKLSTTPAISSDDAQKIAVTEVARPTPDKETGVASAPVVADLRVVDSKLLVYREGLLQGVPGPNYLVYEVEVTDGASVREFVYVDAHTGKIVNRISAIQDALFRRLYEVNTSNQVWQEGDLFPGALNQDQQNIVSFSGDSYYLFFNAFGRDSYDAAGAELRSINNNPAIACPNATWNGITTNYCAGVTADDVVAHEWGHAYTEYTNDLIYQWQPGALNESYSDIWGEVVDLLNGKGTDAPAPVRSDNACTLYVPGAPQLVVNSPASIAGNYAAGAAAFGPPLTAAGTTGTVVLADDGSGVTSDACQPLVNGAAISGNLALVDRGSCTFTSKVKNAQNAGAIGVIVANNVAGAPITMGGADPTITIPSLMVSLDTGNLIKAELGSGVNATMRLGGGVVDDSYRWLMGEDATAFGGAIRDMWTPTCASDPGKVSDSQYHCATSDGGGVHTNSGVPNHGFALLVDGGTYNGQTVTAIGLVKAAHLHWRAQSVYLTPSSGFADHADALEASCSDLVGVNLEGLSTSSTPAGPSGQAITAADCAEVSDMIAAVEFRTDPAAQCNFQPLLQPNPPALCAGTGFDPTIIALEDFEAGLGNWTLSNQGVFAGWPGLDWTQDASLPGGRPGAAALGIDPAIGNCDGGAGDVSGVMRMESALIVIPPPAVSNQRLAFDHYVATELGWDGGNLKISINGGPYTEVPPAAFLFNPYNSSLQPAAAGNTNPLAGQRAFTGTDGGSVGGSWGQSQIDLAALGVNAGDTVRLRFDMGIDGCTGIDGWYVDDVNVYACYPNTAPTISVAGGQCAEDGGASGTVNVILYDIDGDSVSLSATSSNTALVPNENIVLGGSGLNRTLSVTAAPKEAGTAVITLVASDGIDTTSLDVTVVVGSNKGETLAGTDGPDMIFGLNGNDTLSGNAGNDLMCSGNGQGILWGGEGDDTMDGGNGDDQLYGEDGDDSLLGQRGDDLLTGGAGADFFSGGQGNDTAVDYTPAEGDTSDGTVP